LEIPPPEQDFLQGRVAPRDVQLIVNEIGRQSDLKSQPLDQPERHEAVEFQSVFLKIVQVVRTLQAHVHRSPALLQVEGNIQRLLPDSLRRPPEDGLLAVV
jgi:hypothetical protein